ncbi:MAG: DUF6462 family protein [Roseburia sp.]|nr:DUF6462 family protein [Roseburia sp.]MCM1099099.1 DUF6462 family protein [Ruminococcus flavefaciens]MCM1222090.1 DUF6462 family protein [Lachnospiraceae bacterium]
MHKMKSYGDPIKYATVSEAMERYRMCRNTLMKLAEECGAVRRFGGAVKIDIPTMDKGMDLLGS